MALLALSCTAAFASVSASAATLNVLTTGAFKQVAAALVPLYESRSGNKINLDNDTAGALAKRVEGGAHFDVVILTPDLLKEFVAKGKVHADSVANLAQVGIGVMVPAGAPRPAIDTVEHFKQALLDAKSVAYIDPASGGSSGIYLAKLFQQWGIAQQIDAKAVKVKGGSVAEHIVDGEAVLGIHQISEILPTKGVTLIGPLPAEIQNYTVYTAGISSTSNEQAAARAFLQLLTSPEAVRLLKEKGMEAVKP
ncbi:ABC transporter substrate-binding protein [Oxalobacteraceae bacterium CAVE-383]|nr:ABC transporter substrate-binding protein [Oxalobacteraceae bacterium CAVE-383]